MQYSIKNNFIPKYGLTFDDDNELLELFDENGQIIHENISLMMFTDDYKYVDDIAIDEQIISITKNNKLHVETKTTDLSKEKQTYLENRNKNVFPKNYALKNHLEHIKSIYLSITYYPKQYDNILDRGDSMDDPTIYESRYCNFTVSNGIKVVSNGNQKYFEFYTTENTYPKSYLSIREDGDCGYSFRNDICGKIRIPVIETTFGYQLGDLSNIEIESSKGIVEFTIHDSPYYKPLSDEQRDTIISELTDTKQFLLDFYTTMSTSKDTFGIHIHVNS